MAIAALDGGLPLDCGRARGRPAPLRGRRALRVGDRAAGRCRSRRRERERRLRGLRAPRRRQGSRHDPGQRRQRRRAHDGRRGRPCSRCSTRCATRRDVVLVDARGTGRSGRVGDRRDAYGAGAAAQDLDAVRASLGIGHVELYGAGDGARIALAYAARFGDRVRALVLDGGPRATLFSGDGRGEAHALARALGKGEPAVARLAARLRTRPLHSHGRIDDDVLARIAANGSAGTLGELPGAATAALHGDPVPLARLAAASAPGTARQAAQAQASDCHDNAAPAPSAQIDGGPFTGATWRRALGLAACMGWPQPAVARSGAAGRRRARRRARARARRRARRARADRNPAQGRRRSCPRATFVRVRGAGALPALGDPGGCAATIARAFLQTRGRVRPALREPAGSGSRSLGVPAQPGSRAAGAARRHGARPRPLDARRPARRHRGRTRRGRRAGRRGGARRARARGGPARRLGARARAAARSVTLTLRGHALRARRGARRSRHARQRDRQRVRIGHAARGRRLAARVRAHLEHAPDRRARRGSRHERRAGRCCSCSSCPENGL